MRYTKLTIALSLFLFCFGCEYFDSKLSVFNASGKTISCEVFNDINTQGKNNIEVFISDSIPPNSTFSFTKMGKHAWDTYLDSSPTKELYMCVYDLDTLEKYKNIETMSGLYAKKKYLSIINLTKNDLEGKNWVVKFVR